MKENFASEKKALEYDWAKTYHHMCMIRLFEERLLEEYHKGNVSGTVHTCIGQELLPILLTDELGEEDYIYASHRCHGYFIGYTGDAQLLLDEILGREDAICGGLAGTQHIIYKHLICNGIQGGIVPNAVGTAFSQKMNKKKRSPL